MIRPELRLAVPILVAFALSSCALFERKPETFPSLPRESGLVVQEVVVPDGRKAAPGDRVTVHYHGTLPNGDVFDSTVERGQPLSFVLGSGEAPAGLDEGVTGMRLFGRRRILSPTELMFPAGAPPGIDEDVLLALELELLAIE